MIAFEFMATEIIKKAESSLLFERVKAQYNSFDSTKLIAPFPKNAMVELSNFCNHSCIFCTNPRMVRKKGFLNIETYKRFVNEAVPLGLTDLGLYTTGEPFVSKNLDEFVSIAKNAGVKYIYLTTNGALATPDRSKAVIDAGLSSIKFSINGGTRETYKGIHGKDDFEKVLDNLRFIANYRKEKQLDLKILAVCVVTKFVREEKEVLKRTLMDLVDELVFFDVGPQAGQSREQLEEIGGMDNVQVYKEEVKPCGMLWNRVHLTWEGYLTLCCVDYEDVLSYADFNKESLESTWNNQVIQEMRKRHQSLDLKGTLCHNCLYKAKEDVFPITNLGNNGLGVPVNYNGQKGSEIVSHQIKSLQALTDRRKEISEKDHSILSL